MAAANGRISATNIPQEKLREKVATALN